MVAREGSGHEVSKSVQKGIAGHKAGGSTRSRRAVGEDRQARIHLRGAGELGPLFLCPPQALIQHLCVTPWNTKRQPRKWARPGSWYGHARSKHQARNLLKCHGVHTATPPRGEKGSVRSLQKFRRAVRNNLREAPWKRPNTRGPQAGDPVRSEDKWEDKHMGSSSSTHPTPDFKRIPDHSKPRVAGRNGVGEGCSTQCGGHRRRLCQALNFSQFHLWKIIEPNS